MISTAWIQSSRVIFIRTYEATVKRIKDEAKIPKAVHAAIEEMFQQAEALEDKGGVL